MLAFTRTYLLQSAAGRCNRTAMDSHPTNDPSENSEDPRSAREASVETSLFGQFRAAARPLMLLILPVALAYLAFELTPGRAVNADNRANVWLLGGLIKGTISTDLQMLLFVILMAGLGGFVGAMNNRAAVKRLDPGKRMNAYLVQTAGASVLGGLFYVLVRAGILTGNTVRDINPVGMAVLSFGVGMSAPAIMKWLRAAVVDIYGEEPEVVQAIQRLEQRFESALSEPTLDNFDGNVWIRLVDQAGTALPMGFSEGNRSYFGVPAGQHCRLEVRFVPGQRHDESSGDLHQELRIRSGNNVEKLTFNVALDSLTIDLPQDRLAITFHPQSSPPPLTFDFLAPENRQEHQLFVEVSQKNRLLQSVPVKLRVGSRET